MSFLLGSRETSQSIPKWLEDSVKSNLEKARLTGEIGYIPYYGPQVAALSPMQQSAMQNTMGAMSAFGMAPQGAQYKSSLPEPMTMGGVTGYGSGDLYSQAVAEAARRDPAQAERYMRAMGVTSGTAPGAGQTPVQIDPRLDQSSPMYDPAYYNRVMASGIDGGGGGGGGGPQVSGNYWAQREAEVGKAQAFAEQSAQNQKINDALTGFGKMGFGGILGAITGGTPLDTRAPVVDRNTYTTNGGRGFNDGGTGVGVGGGPVGAGGGNASGGFSYGGW